MSTASKARKIMLGIVIAVLLALFIIKKFVIGSYTIPQNGMYPGLPAGSRILTLRHAYSDAADVTPGDIVVFVREENGQNYNYIWRVVGRPGDVIVISGDDLSINGHEMQRSRFRQVGSQKVYAEDMPSLHRFEVAYADEPAQPRAAVSITVPPGHFFVMGDNRDDSRDSRYFGPIPFTSIIGRKIWP